MNTTQRNGIMQRWRMVQHELMPALRNEVGALTPKLEQVVHTLEWVRIEEFVRSSWKGCGRPEHDRGMLANAFVAKAVLGLPTTAGLIERLSVDRALRRICGFSMWKKLIRTDKKDIARDTGDIRQDKRERRQDIRERNRDRRELMQDKRKGDAAGVDKERQELAKDNADIKKDNRDIAKDRAGRRQDRRDLHSDRKDRRHDVREKHPR